MIDSPEHYACRSDNGNNKLMDGNTKAGEAKIGPDAGNGSKPDASNLREQPSRRAKAPNT